MAPLLHKLSSRSQWKADADCRIASFQERPLDRSEDETEDKAGDGLELVRRLQAELPHGTAAFRDLVELYTPRIRQRAFRVVGNSSDADEVVQDVFLRVFRSIRRFRLDKPLQHWLYTITSNSARNLLRTRARDQRRTSEFVRESRVQADSPEQSDQILDGSLEAALDSLDPTTRMAIVLRYVEELSFPEIARDLELGESAVKMRVRRGLEKLKLGLEDNDHE
jgi:RNA polymerase sigma-70 factor (ECF subfamily)